MHGYDHPWAGGAGKNKLGGGTFTDTHATHTFDELTGSCRVTCTSGKGQSTLRLDDVSALVGQTVTFSIKDYSISKTSFKPYVVIYKNSTVSLGNLGDAFQGIIKTSVSFVVPNDTTHLLLLMRIDQPETDVTGDYLQLNELQLELGSNKTTFAPYSNICPISGRTGTTVSTRNEDNTETASVTLSFGQTVYGGQVDFKTGNVTVEWGYIASYNGETLPGAWISDRDVYAAGATPTTDAEVCYELATPTTLSLTPDILTMLKNNNSVSGDGVITITALTGDSWS